MKKRTGKVRKFGNELYRYHDTRERRADADRIAEWLRSRGFKVRVTGDYKTGYKIWKKTGG